MLPNTYGYGHPQKEAFTNSTPFSQSKGTGRAGLNRAQRRRANRGQSEGTGRAGQVTPISSYEIEIARVVRAELVSPIIKLHRYLKKRGAGGYSISIDGFAIDGSKLNEADVKFVTKAVAPIVGVA